MAKQKISNSEAKVDLGDALEINKKDKRSVKGCLYRTFKCILGGTLVLLVTLLCVLYYFLGTLSGARNALEIAQSVIPEEIFIDTTIESGSVLEGLQLGNTLVDIKDIVAISADNLTLDYDLWHLTTMLFKVNAIKSQNLSVALSDKLFEGPPTEDEPEDPNEPPFRLSFPVDIDLDCFEVQNFNFRSQIVDVEAQYVYTKAKAHEDNIFAEDTTIDAVTVHLKSESDVAHDQAQVIAATRADEALAIKVDDKVIALKDIDSSSVDALVIAAQQGKSVEVVVADVEQAKEDAIIATEADKIAKDAQEAQLIAYAQANDAEQKQAAKQAKAQAKAQKEAAKNNASKSGKPSVYEDPAEFAKAMEKALLYREEVPEFAQAKLDIHDPRGKQAKNKDQAANNAQNAQASSKDNAKSKKQSQAQNDDKLPVVTFDSLHNVDEFEARLLSKLEEHSKTVIAQEANKSSKAKNSANGKTKDKQSVGHSEAELATQAAFASAASAASSSAYGNGNGASAHEAGSSYLKGESDVAAHLSANNEVGEIASSAALASAAGNNTSNVASSTREVLNETSKAHAYEDGEPVYNEDGSFTDGQYKTVDAGTGASELTDGVSGATADTLARQARSYNSHRGEQLIDKANEESERNIVAIKEFGSGNGAIEELPKIILPFNIEAKNAKITKARYYMEGFDTREGDIAFDASWIDTNLKITKFDFKHVFGEVKATGDMYFDKYYRLDFKLAGEGYENAETHDFMEGLLYGLSGDFEVDGDLTDLTILANLNLGGSSELKLHGNVLSGALPLMVDLKTHNITYPIFGEPIVNVKRLDLHTSGNLIDGIDFTFDGDVTGYGFEDVVTKIRSQISFDKAHIEEFKVNGLYQKEKLEADIKGDVFYGKVLGVDAKVSAQIADLGFLAPELKGAFKLNSDLVAILNNEEKGKSAVSVASEPIYLPNRIPKTTILREDLDADSLEQRLLANVKTKGISKEAALIKNTRNSPKPLKDNSNLNAAAMAIAGKDNGKRTKNATADIVDDNYDLVDAAQVDAAEAQLLAGGKLSDSAANYLATVAAMKAVSSGEGLSAVRPISSPESLAGGVADGPTDLLISKEEYVDAVRFTESNKGSASRGSDEDTIFNSIFNEDLPEIMTNVHYISGELFYHGHKTIVDIKNIVGDIHQGFRVELLKVTQGSDNLVMAEGMVTPTGADLNAIIDLGNLEKLAPGVKGSLKAYIKSTGDLKDLNFELAGSAPRIQSGDMRIRKLVFNSAFNMQTRSLNLTALAERVRWSKSIAANRHCFFDLSGTPLRHTVSANCSGTTAAYFNIDGSLNMPKKHYSANFLELYLSTESSGSISLQHPVFLDLDYGQMIGEITPINLMGEIGNLNVAKTTFNGDNVKSKLSLREFNLGALQDFFPEGLKMMVPLDVDADIAVVKGNPDIKVNVASHQGAVFSSVGAGIVYDEFTLNSHITKTKMHNTLAMNLYNGKGKVDSTIDILDPAGAGRLAGHFKIIDFDLETISNIGQSFNELKGLTNVDLTLGGNLSDPKIFGSITSKGSAIPRYDVGQINDFNIDLKLNGTKGDLDGKITLNGGKLNLGGELDWSKGADGSLTAQATNLPIFLVGYGMARANIDTKATLGEVLDISGKVEIPTARISVKDVGDSGVSVSSDEMLIPKEGASALVKQKPANNLKSTIDLTMSFGDDVRFAAMGMVKGHLAGGIKVKKLVTDQNVGGSGEIRIEDATADLYGRKFNFSQARIIFNRDITNPTLNIAVVADPEYIEDEVEVGVKVTGTAQAPDINLFSRPSMSENEILSYILYGHGLDKSALNTDSNNSNMLLGVGMSGISGIASAMATSMGLENVQFNTQGSGDETQVAVQGYITRKLRVSYGYGVFNSVGEFKLRYELMRNLYAEFVSSLDQAVDLVYSFEFD